MILVLQDSKFINFFWHLITLIRMIWQIRVGARCVATDPMLGEIFIQYPNWPWQPKTQNSFIIWCFFLCKFALTVHKSFWLFWKTTVVSIWQKQDTSNMQNNFFLQGVMQDKCMISMIIIFWSICIYKGYINNHFAFLNSIKQYDLLCCTFVFYDVHFSLCTFSR